MVLFVGSFLPKLTFSNSLRLFPNTARGQSARRKSTSTISPLDQTFHLPDGRQLGFAEFGNPDGKPLLYFHGYPSSRLEAQPADALAKKHNIRLIALDRPGYGLSTPQSRRRIMDWPADVQAFADGMSISRFSVMGLSGGGPFALACAYALPRERLASVGLFASGPPWAAGANLTSRARRIFRAASIHVPELVRMTLNCLVKLTTWLVNTSYVSKSIESWLQKQDEKKDDPEMSTNKPLAERREAIVRMLLDEPFRQGAEAAVVEARLLSDDDWGFRFEDVEHYPLWIWHGAKDTNAPVEMIRYMADRLPHCVMREFESDTHYTMYKHIEGAFEDMLSKGAGDKKIRQDDLER